MPYPLHAVQALTDAWMRARMAATAVPTTANTITTTDRGPERSGLIRRIRFRINSRAAGDLRRAPERLAVGPIPANMPPAAKRAAATAGIPAAKATGPNATTAVSFRVVRKTRPDRNRTGKRLSTLNRRSKPLRHASEPTATQRAALELQPITLPRVCDWGGSGPLPRLHEVLKHRSAATPELIWPCIGVTGDVMRCCPATGQKFNRNSWPDCLVLCNQSSDSQLRSHPRGQAMRHL